MKNLNKFWKVTTLALLCLMVAFSFAGCSKEKTTDGENVSEIDAFVLSVAEVKKEYDNNKITKTTVENAAMQAVIIKGFLSESPELLNDEEYQYKITEAYNALLGIDLNKEGLEKEDIEKDYNQLSSVVTSLYETISK